ncbi:DUF4232 domain-containing protein [Streptomyces sp. NPDC049040]|uniref:DUF4232 domain-containing protein n=1 Tax=Streptomyces sp. NPDC049040 TaxID=3365593 RepID=UPI00371EAC92
MTGFPDRDGGDPGGGGADPQEPLLRQPPGYLDAPPGAFAQIRRRAARRRRARAAVGGLAAAVVLTGSVYLAGALAPHGSDHAVSPPASDSPTTTAPPLPTATRQTTREPSATPATGRRTSDARGGAGTATGRTATSTPAKGGGATGSASPATTPMCATSQLTASLGGGDAGAGSLFRYLLLTNHSSTTCHLTGYPGLSMLDAKGGRIGAPADRQPMDYAPVVLRPGESASDTIHTVNQQGSCLPASTKLRIYPPGNTAWLDFAGRVTDCDDLFTVTPFVAGRTGNPPS